MNARQCIAFLAPCARAWETLAPDFREMVRHKGGLWSTIFTVNK